MVVEAIIDIACEDFLADVPELEAKVKQAVELALNEAAEEGDYSLALRFSDDAEVQKLNREFRSKDAPTNVLSFPDGSEDPEKPSSIYLGDVILAHGVLVREVAEQEKKFEDHMIHLVVHGVLHLLGYDHMEEDEAEEMEELEIDILATLGIANPYH